MREIETSRSFRDPDGFVFRSDDRIFRRVLPHAAGDALAFLSSAFFIEQSSAGVFPATQILETESNGALFLEHEPIPFPNYPYEWSSAMLHAAGVLSLELARRAMKAGFILKDATPYNVMFEGPRPVFLDILSFRRRDALESMWPAYAQYVQTFLYPMLAAKHFDLRLDETLLAHRDGLEPDRLMAIVPWYRRLLPPFLGAVTIPALLERNGNDPSQGRYGGRRAKDPAEAAFVLDRLFKRALKQLDRQAAPQRHGEASRYMDDLPSYTRAEFETKGHFVDEMFRRVQPKQVLDIGCNTGHFSLLAARTGASVVAIDRDPDVAAILWRAASHERLDILPLVVDIARPPGGCGWLNQESAPFLDRARGRFDYVLMLALIHHLLVSERIPLSSIFDLAADLTTRFAVVEYIDPGDAQFRKIARGRDSLHADLTRNVFESDAQRHFQIVEAREVSPVRRIYLLEKMGT